MRRESFTGEFYPLSDGTYMCHKDNEEAKIERRAQAEEQYQRASNQPDIKHGSAVVCPTCKHQGRIDFSTSTWKDAAFDDSVFKCPNGLWRCTVCGDGQA